MFKVKLEVEYKSDWSKDLMKKFNCEMKSIYCQNISKNKVIDVIRVKNSKELEENLVEFLEKYKEIESCEILDKGDGNLFFKTITTMDKTNNGNFVRNSCFQLNLVFKNGKELWTFITNKKSNVKNLIKDLNDGSREAKLISIVSYSYEMGDLTEKQFGCLKDLYEKGYFEVPKKITLEKQAKRLNTTKSNLNAHLNKALKKIVVNFFENN